MFDVKKFWYQDRIPLWPLYPFSLLYSLAIQLIRNLYLWGILRSEKCPVPVVVVGNITAGGTGKTPLVIHLVNLLRQYGMNPGVISRGYKGRHTVPTIVQQNSDPIIVGDEALLLVQRLNCPMVVAQNRVLGIKKLLQSFSVDVVISDDGLQHYPLHRDIEIAVIDGARRFGNRVCLPVGPLREPVSRLASVHLVVVNGTNVQSNEYQMIYEPRCLYQINQPSQQKSLESLRGQTIHAVAGIGNTDRFFELLKAYGLSVIPHAYPDHYLYQANDILFPDDHAVIMTEKDAVKCAYFVDQRHWALSIDANVSPIFDVKFLDLLKGVKHG